MQGEGGVSKAKKRPKWPKDSTTNGQTQSIVRWQDGQDQQEISVGIFS